MTWYVLVCVCVYSTLNISRLWMIKSSQWNLCPAEYKSNHLKKIRQTNIQLEIPDQGKQTFTIHHSLFEVDRIIELSRVLVTNLESQSHIDYVFPYVQSVMFVGINITFYDLL